MLLGPVNKIRNDKKIARKSHVADDAKFIVETRAIRAHELLNFVTLDHAGRKLSIDKRGKAANGLGPQKIFGSLTGRNRDCR